MRLLGLDPGLRITGWGVVDVSGQHLSFVDCGTVKTDSTRDLAARLVQLHDALAAVIARFDLDGAAVEETFVNRNPASTLKLGQARGVTLLAPALAGLEVSEYAANLIKKSVVGTGHASKYQVAMMVRTLLPGCVSKSPDALDALAVAICYAHHRTSAGRLERALASAEARP
jgi:crossover junction endodeoxyribonuclease RuvC